MHALLLLLLLPKRPTHHCCCHCCLCTEPLHEVVFGRTLTLTLTKPTVDCSLDDGGELPRLLRLLQQSMLGPLLPFLPQLPPQQSNSGSSSSSAQEPAAAAAAEAEQQQGAAAAAPAGGHSRSSSASSSAGSAEPAGRVASHPILESPEALAAAEAEATADEAAAALAKLGSAAGAVLSPLRRRLTQADAVSHLSGEVRLPYVALYIPDGALLLPAEAK